MNGNKVYGNFLDRVDVDEKWFYVMQETERGYVVVSDDDDDDDDDNNNGDERIKNDNKPIRKAQHKRFIRKVMFLCAQARPKFDLHRNAVWSGKLGCWPIGTWAPAQRNSTYRPQGTLIWKNTTITKEVYRKILMEKVVPSIEQNWPQGAWNNENITIKVQQDSPNSHISQNDNQFKQFLRERDLLNKIQLVTQPAQSPDLNINDLGFFRALQAEYEKKIQGTQEI